MIYVLATDTLDHFHRANAKVLQRATAVNARDLAISVITRIEVLRARFDYILKADTAAKQCEAQHWLNVSDKLLAAWRILPVDDASSSEFVRLRAQKGLRKIGRADMLIASIVLANRATLVTCNVRDFSLVNGMMLENWVD